MEPYKEFEKHQNIEVTLRGTVLNVAVKLEAILMNIVYLTNAEQYQNMSESPSLKLKNLTFGGKIKRTKELLATYHRDLLDENEELFKQLETFLDIRNKMAHCSMLMLDAEANHLEIWETSEENKIQFYKPVKYSRLEIISSVIKTFNQIAPLLTTLQNEVESRLLQSNPDLHGILSPELKPQQ